MSQPPFFSPHGWLGHVAVQSMDCVGTPPIIVDAFHSGMRVCRVTDTRIDHEWCEHAARCVLLLRASLLALPSPSRPPLAPCLPPRPPTPPPFGARRVELANVPQTFEECFDGQSSRRSGLQLRPALDEIMGLPTGSEDSPPPVIVSDVRRFRSATTS